MKYFYPILCLFGLYTFSAQAQESEILTKYPEVIDGSVRTITIDEEMDRIYLSGNFTQLRENDTEIRPFLSTFTSDQTSLINETPEVNGFLRDVISDGEGGYFITGEFTKVGSFDRNGIAHITADNQVTALNLDIDGDIFDIHLDSEKQVLYLAGFFNTVNGIDRKNFFAVDYNSYDVLPFNPTVNGPVYDIEQKGDTIFIGGGFSGVGEIRGLSVSYNPTTKDVSDKGPFSNRAITAATPDGEGGWYIAGQFTNIKDSLRGRIARIDADGNATAFNADIFLLSQPLNTRMHSLLLHEGALYVGGFFNRVNGEEIVNMAKLDAETGEVLPFTPNPNGDVRQIGLYNDSLLVCGSFTNIAETTTKRYIALLDTESGNASESFDINVDDDVFAFNISDGFIQFAGEFSGVGTQPSALFFTVDLNNPSFIPVAAGSELTGTVFDMAVKGDTAFLAGNFSGTAVEELAAINWTTGELLDWTPSLNTVADQLEIIGDKLFVGGYFVRVDGEARPLIAAYNVDDLTLTSDAFAFSLQSTEFARCTALEESNGEILVATSAGQIQEDLRLSFAAFDLSGEALDLSIPFSEGLTVVPTNLQIVYDIEIIGDKVYGGGNFSGANLNGSQYLASASIITGEPDLPIAQLNERVFTLAQDFENNKLYFAGDFTEMNEETKRFIARVDLTDGEVDPWGVFIKGSFLRDIEIADDEIYVGGEFTKIKGVDRQNLAALTKVGFNVTDFNPDPDSQVNSISENAGEVTFGGSFNTVKPSLAEPNDVETFAILDRTTGQLLDAPTSPNVFADEIVIDGDRILFAGGFSQFGDSARQGIAALDRETLEVTEWGNNLSLLGDEVRIRDIELNNDRVYFVAGNTDKNLGALDRATGALLDWPEVEFDFSNSPAGDGFYSIVASDTSIFVGGEFFMASPQDGSLIFSIVEIGKQGGELTDFSINEFTGPLGSSYEIARALKMLIYQDDIIVAGQIAANGEGIVKVNTLTGDLVILPNAGLPTGGGDPFNNSTYASGRDLFLSGNLLYFAADAYAAEYSLLNNAYTAVYSNEDWYDIVFDTPPIGGPRWDPIYTAFSIAADSEGKVFIGGNFEEIIDRPRRGLAVLKTTQCESPLSGSVTTTSVTRDICLNNEQQDIVQAEVAGNTGNGVFILHNSDYDIFSVRQTGTFKPDNHPPGNYFVSHVAYTDDNLNQTDNLNDLEGCLSVSGSFAVTSFRAEAGQIGTSDPKDYCVGDLPATISFDRINSSGINQGFVLLNNSNQIIEVSTDGTFVLEDLTPGKYKVASVSTDETVVLEDIQASNLDPCFDYSNIVKIDIETCEELLIASNPNPVVDVSNVSFTTTESENVQLELYDLTGKRIGLIYAGMAPGQTPMMFQYDTSSLPQGVYIYKLTTESEVKTTKFLKN
ncbi:T9SS type A sorting domain-containing protein [Cryomorphaceae bacterium 1068]|nr:T9SS type A sorting domain-containing protein [Cryomorphaceae bacterium 1068]